MRHIRAGPSDGRPGYCRATIHHGETRVGWFEFRPHGRGVYLVVDGSSRALISERSLGRILRDADRSIELFGRAEAVVADRAADILAGPPEAVTLAVSMGAWVELSTRYSYRRGGDAFIRVSLTAHNRLQIFSRVVRHARWISLSLVFGGRGEEELAAQLAEDLAEIFKQPELTRFRQEIPASDARGSQAVIWSETTAHRTLDAGRGEVA